MSPSISKNVKLSRLQLVVLCLITGISLGASGVAGPMPIFAFVYGIALLIVCANAPTTKSVFLRGWLVGFFSNATIFYWIVELLVAFAHFHTIIALLVASLLWAAQGLITAFACWLGEGLSRAGLPRYVTFPVITALVITNAPSLFPWGLGISLVEWTTFAQVGEFGGAPLLDVLVALVGAGLGTAIWRWSHGFTTLRSLRAPLIVAGLALGVPLAYGLVRVPELEALRESAPRVRVGIIQPNVGIEDKHNRRLAQGHLRDLRLLTHQATEDGADFVVWPETAYPFPIDRRLSHDVPGERRIGSEVPILVGAITVGGPCERWNSAMAFDAQGRVTGISDKVVLLPFGETVPLWHVLPPLQEMFRCPGLSPGEHSSTLELADVSIGTLNCYEDVLGGPARSFVEPPELLVNITNDAWFGDSAEPHLHQLAARLRAVETRRDLIRAVNTGVSAHVDFLGREVARTHTFERAVLMADARRFEGSTHWTRFGDQTSPAIFCLVLVLFFTRRKKDSHT